MDKKDHQIEVLKGAERVRRRPVVVFGAVGNDGAMTAVEQMIHLMASECVDGYSNLLKISVNADHVVSLSNYGRGIYFGKPDDTNDTIWKELFCEVYAGARCEDFFNKDIGYTIFDENAVTDRKCRLADELTLVSVQYASAFMDVISIRDGYEYRLSFERGENVGGLSKSSCSVPSGTQITFKPDPEVFGEYTLCGSNIKEMAELIALTNPGVTVEVSIDGEESLTYCYPDGVQSYMEERCDHEQGTPIFRNQIEGIGQDRYNYPGYHAQVEIGISFAPNRGYIKCIHNLRELAYGGTHIDTLKSEIRKYIGYQLESRLSEEQLLKHLQIVVITYTDGNSHWVNGTQRSISHQVIRDMAEDTIKDNFGYFLKQNATKLEKLYK